MYCHQAAWTYICNYIFIPCDRETGSVVEICKEDCRHFLLEDSFCSGEFDFLVGLSSQTGITIPKRCNDTLYLLEKSGMNLSRSTECLRIQGKLKNVFENLINAYFTFQLIYIVVAFFLHILVAFNDRNFVL